MTLQAEITKAQRLLRYDAGLLFLWCWLLGFGHAWAAGHPDIPFSLGAGVFLFIIGAAVLIATRRSQNRYRNAVITSTLAFALAMFGVWSAITHP